MTAPVRLSEPQRRAVEALAEAEYLGRGVVFSPPLTPYGVFALLLLGVVEKNHMDLRLTLAGRELAAKIKGEG